MAELNGPHRPRSAFTRQEMTVAAGAAKSSRRIDIVTATRAAQHLSCARKAAPPCGRLRTAQLDARPSACLGDSLRRLVGDAVAQVFSWPCQANSWRRPRRALELGAVASSDRARRIVSRTSALCGAPRPETLLERAQPVDRQRVEVPLTRHRWTTPVLHLSGENCACLRSSSAGAAVEQRVVASRSEPNCAKAAIRDTGKLALDAAGDLLHALVCAAEPTRDTDRPTFTAPDALIEQVGLEEDWRR